MNDCRDENGGISRARVIQRALMHPGSLPMLLELRKRVNASSERLAGFVVELLRGGN